MATALQDAINSVDPSDLDSVTGDSISVSQQAYNAGVNIGGYFSTLKSILNSDIGPVGGFVLFLLAMIVLNIQIRLILFLIPIVKKIVEFITQVIDKIQKAIVAFFLL